MLMQRKGAAGSLGGILPVVSPESRKKNSVGIARRPTSGNALETSPASNGRTRSLTSSRVPTHIVPHVPMSITYSSSSTGCAKFALILVTICMFIAGGQVRQQQLKVEMESLEQSRIELERRQDMLHRKLQEVRREADDKDAQLAQAKDGFENQKRELEKMLQERLDLEDLHKDSKSLDENMEGFVLKRKQETSTLQMGIQRLAKTQAIEHFGQGPHFVEFEVQLRGETKRSFFTVEMASLDYMPASVNLFLHQVSKGLWDNTSFFLNPEHVAMAQPVSANRRINHLPYFKREGLESVPFAEYSDTNPHVPYTIGFAGSPAGPIWYINKKDNTFAHGPDGHQDDGSPEPSFGTIIIGKDVIDLLDKQPHRVNSPHLLTFPVAIISARIRELRLVHGGWKYIQEKQNEDPGFR